MNTNSNYKNERVLKVLIIIGILAILVSIYIQYLKPFITELSSQKRDQTRIQNLSSINSALIKLQEINPNFPLGEPNKVYISVPSSNPNCDGLELPPLPDGWEYRCKPETEFCKIDGNGWMPVDFTQFPKDFDFESSLPIDSANTADSGYYYAYIAGENGWVLASLLESDKYLKQSALKDGGTDPTKFEVGSNLRLWAKASGLVGYWKFDEGKGTAAADSSGNNTETLMNEPAWVDGKLGKALSFNGKDTYVKTLNPLNIENGELTYEAWAYLISDGDSSHPTIIGERYSANGYVYMGYQGRPNFYLIWHNGITANNVFFNASQYYDDWHHFVGVLSYSGNYARIYVDGVLKAEKTTGSFAFKLNDQTLIGAGSGVHSWKGYIDEVKIYNRVLNQAKIQTIFNITK